jgi:hypothetical protein
MRFAMVALVDFELALWFHVQRSTLSRGDIQNGNFERSWKVFLRLRFAAETQLLLAFAVIYGG